MHRNQTRDRNDHWSGDERAGRYDEERDRERYQPQGMGQRGDRGYLAPREHYERGYYEHERGPSRYERAGSFDNYGHYDRRDQRGYDQRAYGQRGYEQRGYDPRHHEQRGYDPRDYDRGTYGGYGRDYDQRGYQQSRGYDEGRFGGSRRDAYDHGEHPHYQRGGYQDEAMYGRNRRDDYGPTYRPGHESANRNDDEDERYHGSSGRNYDQDWYGRASASPWNAWGRNRY